MQGRQLSCDRVWRHTYLAFPHDSDTPPLASKLPCDSEVTSNVVVEFLEPEGLVAFWRRTAGATGMTMPKASVYEDYKLGTPEHYVRRSWKRLGVKLWT
jgi:hypothetical protein